MVLLTVTPAMSKAVERLKMSDGNTAFESSNDIGTFNVGDPVSHSRILELSKALKGYNETQDGAGALQYHLDALLQGSQVYTHPKPPSREKTSEYRELMNRLHREEEERLYAGMVQPRILVNSPLQSAALARQNLRKRITDAEDPDEMTFADVNRQVALIINVLVSIIACGIAIWLVSSRWSAPSRLALSMSGSGVVGIAEVVIYAGYIRRLKLAREKERSKPEHKTVEETWVIEKNSTPPEPTRITASGRPETSGPRRRLYMSKAAAVEAAKS